MEEQEEEGKEDSDSGSEGSEGELEGALAGNDQGEASSEVRMEVGSTDGVLDEGEGGNGQVDLEQLEVWLKSQGHRARRTAEGGVVIDPVPKPKPSASNPTLNQQLSKLKVVTPLMRSLEL